LEIPSDLWPSVGDPRVDAIVSIDGGAHDFGYEGINALEIPALLMFARSADGAIPYNHDQLLEMMDDDPQAMVIFENADHALFMPPCLEGMLSAETIGFCAEPVWDKLRAHDLVHHFSTAFLRDVFYGDTEAHAALMSDAVTFPGITYQTTMQ
jgi:predicted dienelactone hydrolase